MMGQEVEDRIEQNCLSKHSAKNKRVNLGAREKHTVKGGLSDLMCFSKMFINPREGTNKKGVKIQARVWDVKGKALKKVGASVKSGQRAGSE